uniref:Uncharacterized protein n=1 Tax=Solanum lycopersicum TaxID=4081 RepID=A0A3Q7H9A3_SOLLC
MKLEHYMNARHPSCGFKSLPHGNSKIRRAWKKIYATISLLKSRSGLGFQYSDGSISVDYPKAWNDLIKTRNRYLARIELLESLQKMMLKAQEKIKMLKRNLMYQLEQHKVHLKLKMNLMNQLEQHKVHSPLKMVKPINLRKRVMKQFIESHDKRMTFLIDKLGECDLSKIRGKIFSIIGSPAYEIYNSDERVKAAMGITQDINTMEFFVHPYDKSMIYKKWPLFADWEKIFRKDGAFEQSAEGPEVDDAPAKKEDQIAEKEPTVSAGATQSSWSAFYASMNLVSANVY